MEVDVNSKTGEEYEEAYSNKEDSHFA